VHGVDAAGEVVLRPAVEAPARLGIVPETAVMPGRYRGVCLNAPLVPRAAGVGAYGAVDAAGLRQALRQAAEERHHGCGGDLRGSHETQHAVVMALKGRHCRRRTGVGRDTTAIVATVNSLSEHAHPLRSGHANRASSATS
jgi:transposase